MIKSILTIGYESKSIDEFIGALKESKPDLLVDVRIRTGSRKRGFSKTKLSEELKASNIEYQHRKELGTPQYLMEVMRKEGHYELEAYESYLDSNIGLVKEFVSQNSDKATICLMCYELNATECHRSVVAKKISDITSAPIQHL